MIYVISGKARSGKDTLARSLESKLQEKGYKCLSIAYADFLKDLLGKCFNLDHEHLYGSKKEEPLYHMPVKGSQKENDYWTTRRLMQYVGTDVFRNIDTDCWINIVKNTVKDDSYNCFIITDARFSDEIDWVIEEGGTHIHIIREERDYVGNSGHASETSLPLFYNYDEGSILVTNDGTLEELEDKVNQIIEAGGV